jgi:hypothetical protein
MRQPSSTNGKPKDKIFVMGVGPALPSGTGMLNSSSTAVENLLLPTTITVFDRNWNPPIPLPFKYYSIVLVLVLYKLRTDRLQD